jgi:transcriptional regulator with XRE-family HTH domain
MEYAARVNTYVNGKDAGRNAAFGPWLNAHIRDRRISQVEFAEKVGVSQGTVSKWLTGLTPRADYLDGISEVLLMDYDMVATYA